MHKIAIVGGGFGGIAIVENIVRQLAERKEHNTEIYIYEPSGQFGCGPPYRADVPDDFTINHLNEWMGKLNITRPKAQDSDFFLWVQGNKEKLKALYPSLDLNDHKGFWPRNLYGRYLTSRYEEIEGFAQEHGIHVHGISHAVTNIKKENGKFIICSEKPGQEMTQSFDCVALAIGPWWPPLSTAFRDTGKYYPSYPPSAYDASFNPNQCIVIQGTGLTATEVALHLLEKGAKNIIMVSRTGQLRMIRTPVPPYQPQFFSLEEIERRAGEGQYLKLDDVKDLFVQEMEAAHGSPIDWQEVLAPSDIQAQLKGNLDCVERGETPFWKGPLYAMERIFRNEIYRRLSPEDKMRIRQHETLLLSYIAAMPPNAAQKLYIAMKDGRLEVTGGMKALFWNKDTNQFNITLSTRRGPHAHALPLDHRDHQPEHDTRTIIADMVIKATGYSNDINHHPLLKEMVKNGIIEPNPAGGIRFNTRTHMAQVNDHDVPGLFAIGQMTFGDRYAPSVTPFMATEAKEIGEGLMQLLLRERALETPLPHGQWRGKAINSRGSPESPQRLPF